MIHALIALGFQAAIGIATGNWWIGGAFALFYMGREHAQAEYRWIEHYGAGRRANMPWWGGFDPKVWNLKSLTDWLLPLVSAACISLLTD